MDIETAQLWISLRCQELRPYAHSVQFLIMPKKLFEFLGPKNPKDFFGIRNRSIHKNPRGFFVQEMHSISSYPWAEAHNVLEGDF